jgi:hypothetical protein
VVTQFEKTIAYAAVGATPLAEERTEEATRPVTRSAVTAEFDAAGTVAETLSGVQIRHGPDGRWYPFTRSGQRWWPAPGASPRADAAFAAALRARKPGERRDPERGAVPRNGAD